MMRGGSAAAGGGYNKLDRVVVEMEKRKEDAVGGGGGGNNNNNSSMPFVDRSKVRILLCDNNNKSSDEVFTLLCKCSYQVTSARTPRQVIDALNAEGRDIDIILSEVDLPISKGLKMLKYIMRDKELQRIPIIMMSAQDDVSVVVKCLKRGAADYLVKPLRTNELLNLWTHMWRRRQMLGLVEKNILSYDIDLAVSDPSDPNTNSLTLFSDDTDDKSRKTNYRKDDFIATTFAESPLKNSSELQLDAPGPSDQRNGQVSTIFKKSGLKFGKSSAFFTYVKTGATADNRSVAGCMDENASRSVQPSGPSREYTFRTCSNKQQGSDIGRQETGISLENYCVNEVIPSRDNVPGITNVGRLYTRHTSLERQNEWNTKEGGSRTIDFGRQNTPLTPLRNQDGRISKEEEQSSKLLLAPRNDVQVNVSRGQGHPPFPYYLPGMMNQVMIPSPAQLYQGNLQNMSSNCTSTLSPCIPLQQHANVPRMASFPYYPFMQHGQMTTTHMWPPVAGVPSSEVKPTQVERREAALVKFRQKRKDRCFDKKVRYINRKKLAERRPRVRGQFVRLANSIEVDLNGQPAVDDSDGDEEEDVDE
ncbi:two-component response regulator-like APRR1 [Papaver somniferum]|uniref:two-component response regulator-like APRR1 n=1 Tax=Papaver somniferum TaxID=3469 RepID=UPI000E6F90DC|nr:two-component response regulator-like APRR1 [Papaver somniferum]